MMSNEEWERKMDFLLNQQDRFDAEMYELKAAQARTKEAMELAAKNISHLAGFIHEGFGLTMNMFKETDREIKALKESQKLTEELLQKFIAKVDRLTGEGQNGLQN
jgi:hypothetical protein